MVSLGFSLEFLVGNVVLFVRDRLPNSRGIIGGRDAIPETIRLGGKKMDANVLAGNGCVSSLIACLVTSVTDAVDITQTK